MSMDRSRAKKSVVKAARALEKTIMKNVVRKAMDRTLRSRRAPMISTARRADSTRTKPKYNRTRKSKPSRANPPVFRVSPVVDRVSQFLSLRNWIRRRKITRRGI
jgi:hypothetical protein